jgi:hypothetical protein
MNTRSGDGTDQYDHGVRRGYSRIAFAGSMKLLGAIDIQANGKYFEYLAQELRRLPSISKQYSRAADINYHRLSKKTSNILHLLNKLSKNDSGSEELLCFGYHVFAQKQ